MYRIMIAEDDGVIAERIQHSLESWGFSAHTVKDFSDVLAEFHAFHPELVLMDISLPFYNGYYWCTKIREISKVPVIFLSSRSDNMDVVMAVNMGGDDYIAKPVSMEVLVAKVQAMLRRTYDYEAGSVMALRDAHFDISRCSIDRSGEKAQLTRNESKLLKLLLQSKGAVVSREQLMLALWDSDEFVDDNTLTVNINRLRKKLDTLGLAACIATHKNQGYAIDE